MNNQSDSFTGVVWWYVSTVQMFSFGSDIVNGFETFMDFDVTTELA